MARRKRRNERDTRAAWSSEFFLLKKKYIYIYARLSMGAWFVEGQVKSIFGMSDLDAKKNVHLVGDFAFEPSICLKSSSAYYYFIFMWWIF